jgi:hypothetical protein
MIQPENFPGTFFVVGVNDDSDVEFIILDTIEAESLEQLVDTFRSFFHQYCERYIDFLQGQSHCSLPEDEFELVEKIFLMPAKMERLYIEETMSGTEFKKFMVNLKNSDVVAEMYGDDDYD